MLYSDLTNKIIKVFYTVYNQLGYGFLEKVYHNSMMIELMRNELFCESQKKINVYYKNQIVGEYYPDIIVNQCVVVELKTQECLIYENECQLINYLRGTDLEVGLLLNFGKKPEFRRKFFTNDRKIRNYP